MPIESATYLHSLNPGNPAGSDPVADTDNHIRLIKQVLKNTFPNISGPVTASQHVLNGGVPIGGILMWSGAINQIPAGWVLCNGGTHTRSDGGGQITAPNLQDRFIVGAGASYGVGATGGSVAQGGSTDSQGSHVHSAWTGAAGSHNHGGYTDYHTLTIAQIPSHDHSLPSVWNMGTGSASAVNYFGQGTLYLATSTGKVGGGQGHRHGINSDGSHSHGVGMDWAGAHAHNVSIPDGRPPFYALAFIMRI